MQKGKDNMKVYFVYFHDAESEIEPYFYAFTEDKEILNKFKTERDKKYFSIVEKEIHKKDFKSFKMYNNAYYLSDHAFKTHDGPLSHIIHFVTNEIEYMQVYKLSDEVFLSLAKYTDHITFKFKSEILEALNNLWYFQVMKLYYASNITYPDFNEIPSFLNGTFSFDVNSVNIDEFAIFLKLYYKTINKDIL